MPIAFLYCLMEQGLVGQVVVHCLLLNTDTVDDDMAARAENVFFPQILVWRPSPRTSLSRRCMNSELVELFDKEGEEGGEEEDAEDIESEDEGDGDTLEGGGEEEGRMKEL